MPFVADPSRYESMSYRRCGRSGVRLPAISLGLWHNFGDDRPWETQRQICRRAFDLGVTHFDLANNYGPPYGGAESNFGRILGTDFAAHRDELDGLLLDFDYTGKLGVLLLQPDGKGVRVFRNLSSSFVMYFSENNVTSGLPASLPGGQRLVLEDWNNDELMDIALARDNQRLAEVTGGGAPVAAKLNGFRHRSASIVERTPLSQGSSNSSVVRRYQHSYLALTALSGPVPTDAAILDPQQVCGRSSRMREYNNVDLNHGRAYLRN
jgi:hypothetical protein